MALLCFCGAETIVKDSRDQERAGFGAYIRRRRECEHGHRFTSLEIPSTLVDAILRQSRALSQARSLLLSIANEIPAKPLPDVSMLKPPPSDPRSVIPFTKRCEQCNEKFQTKRDSSRFCSRHCAGVYHALERRDASRARKKPRVIEQQVEMELQTG